MKYFIVNSVNGNRSEVTLSLYKQLVRDGVIGEEDDLLTVVVQKEKISHVNKKESLVPSLDSVKKKTPSIEKKGSIPSLPSLKKIPTIEKKGTILSLPSLKKIPTIEKKGAKEDIAIEKKGSKEEKDPVSNRSKSIDETFSYLSLYEIDPFDWNLYKKDYKLFSKYYTDVELYYRLFSWIQYKYGFITREQDREKLDKEAKSGGKFQDIEKFLNSMSTTFDLASYVGYFYAHYNEELCTIDQVESVAERYNSHKSLLINRLYRKYVDQEHKDRDLDLD